MNAESLPLAGPGTAFNRSSQRARFTRSNRESHGCEPWPGLTPCPQPARSGSGGEHIPCYALHCILDSGIERIQEALSRSRRGLLSYLGLPVPGFLAPTTIGAVLLISQEASYRPPSAHGRAIRLHPIRFPREPGLRLAYGEPPSTVTAGQRSDRGVRSNPCSVSSNLAGGTFCHHPEMASDLRKHRERPV